MEQETKFKIENKSVADKIWDSALCSKYGEISCPETVLMRAYYYDTEDCVLRNKGISLRCRSENDACFATLKWGSSGVVNGLYEHQEINIPVDCESCFISPPAELFKESIDGRRLAELIEGKDLISIVMTDIQRRRLKVCFGKSVMELAIDEGTVKANGKTAPISEIEIELYSGEIGDVLRLTDKISEKYGLVPENKSKYARGLELLCS